MSQQAILKYRTRGNVSPQGKPRVYFCCSEEDFDNVFDPVCTEVLEITKNSTIWYRDPDNEEVSYDSLFEYLSQMQLFVVPVTARFLLKDNKARKTELPFAFEHNIPVLFLMQQEGLGRDFNRVVGSYQYLDRFAFEKDQTALPYDKKLRRFLNAVLISDELIWKIRGAFDKYIFLSYRKKDRAHAQRIMKKIHENGSLRDVAIWYDEFLTPGENFNREIEAAINKCDLLALAVTPNLLEENNYVMRMEYPYARDAGKPIVPIEACKTDNNELKRLFTGIDDTVCENEAGNRIQELISVSPLNNSPEQLYLIGRAYLGGVDVEVSYERALEMITAAAETGYADGYRMLVSMYYNGNGVERDYHRAIEWQKRYIAYLKEKDESKEKIAEAVHDLGIYQVAIGLKRDAADTYRKVLELVPENNDWYLNSCDRLIRILMDDQQYGEA